MGKIIEYIASETEGKPFASYRFCYDVEKQTNVENVEEQKLRNLQEYAENVKDASTRNMAILAQAAMKRKPLFHYFLDGSRMVYKVDDIQYDSKVYPVIAGQISVACCEREMLSDEVSFGSFSHVDEEAYSVLSLPEVANPTGERKDLFFGNLCRKTNEQEIAQRNNLTIRKILPYSTLIRGDETLEKHAIACVQDEMIACEKAIVARLVAKHKLSRNSYLIKDGSLQYKTMKSGEYGEMNKIRSNYQCVVGVSKTFNPDFMKDNKNRSMAADIANLPLFHRTPAFKWKDPSSLCEASFAIWYVRIRQREYTSNPYAGVLKIEKMLMTGQEDEFGLDTEEINMITANIINERNPVCYGTDDRWANHLYPVYMTEKYCKSKFKSAYYFLNLF